MGSQYTNSDIMDKLMAMSIQSELIRNDVVEFKTRMVLLDTRVTKIEEFINALKAVDQYKKENPTQKINAQTVVYQQQKWFQNEKLVGGVVAVLLAVAAALGFAFAGATH